MNSNQLFKCLRKSKNLYNNLSSYSEIIKASSNIKLDISDFSNKEEAVARMDEALKSEIIALPFDDMFFDIKNYKMPNLLIGEEEEENIGLHLQCLQMQLDENTYINMTMVQDFRKYIDNAMGRSYIAYTDMAGLHIQPMIDKIAASKGCRCYEQNVFNNKLEFADALASRTPDLKINAGYCLPDCSKKQEGCVMVTDQVDDITDLFKIVMGIMIHPKSYLVSVFNKKKDQHEGYLMLDEVQIDELDYGVQLFNLPKFSLQDGKLFASTMSDEVNQGIVGKKIDQKVFSYTVIDKQEMARS